MFAEPWQAQAFALAVKLSEHSHFTWKEWAATLAVKAMGEMASDPAIKSSFRLRAIELLLRVGTSDHRASPDAKIQLTLAVPLLKKIIT